MMETFLKTSKTKATQNPVSILKGTEFLNTSAAKSAATPGVLKSVVFKEPLSWCTAGPKVLQKTCISIRTSSTTVNDSGYSGMNPRATKVLPQTSVTSLALAKVSQQLVKPIYTNASVKKLTEVKTEAGAHKSSSVATKLNKGMPASSENKRLLKEPSNVFISREMPWRSLVKIGLNQLIIVSCEEKQQVYCQLCLVRLRTSSHSTSFTHCCNYVTMKYPEWITNVSNLEDRLGNIVDHLAAIEKDLGPQKPQKVEVKRDLYLTLATLSEKEAVEKLKAIVRQGPLVSSSAAETKETSQQKVSCSCEVSSSDDGVCVQQKEISTFSANNRSGQKGRRLQQIRDAHVKGGDGKAQQAGNLIQKHLQPSISGTQMDPDSVPGNKADDRAETARRDPFVADAQTHQVTRIIEGLSGNVQQEDLLFPLERRLIGSSSPSHDSPKAVDCRPDVKICSLQKRAGPAQMRETGPRHKAVEAPTHGTAHQGHRELQSSLITSFGREAPGSSNLSFYLQVRQVEIKRVIGIDCVWECQGICLETFFLCESCEETISCCDICQHVVSLDHQLRCIWKKHPEFLQMFWLEADLPQAFKMNLLEDVVWMLAERDSFLKLDAKCIILEQELHRFVRTAQFSEALKTVQNILNDKKPTILSLSATPK